MREEAILSSGGAQYATVLRSLNRVTQVPRVFLVIRPLVVSYHQTFSRTRLNIFCLCSICIALIVSHQSSNHFCLICVFLKGYKDSTTFKLKSKQKILRHERNRVFDGICDLAASSPTKNGNGYKLRTQPEHSKGRFNFETIPF